MKAASTRSVRNRRMRSFLCGFFGGVFATNCFPHSYFGIFGIAHSSPFGAHSSPGVNLAWGLLNALLAAVILRFGPSRGSVGTPLILGAAIAAAATVLALTLAWS